MKWLLFLLTLACCYSLGPPGVLADPPEGITLISQGKTHVTLQSPEAAQPALWGEAVGVSAGCAVREDGAQQLNGDYLNDNYMVQGGCGESNMSYATGVTPTLKEVPSRAEAVGERVTRRLAR